jgi:RimJ/RimL family protein N-acetyltransferase
MPPDELGGDVFVLRALGVDDWALEQALSRDAEVVKWTFYPADLSAADARTRIDRSLQPSRQATGRRYVITSPAAEPVGTCGIAQLESQSPEVFYAVLAQARGQGAATDAARALANWALQVGYDTVALVTVAGNSASEQVARNAGFLPVAQFEDEHRGEPATLTRWQLSRQS